MLKVFVYSKLSSKQLVVYENVVCVVSDDDNKLIIISTPDGVFKYDTRLCKTTIYQN